MHSTDINKSKTILILANNDMGLYKFRKELIEALLEKYEVVISLPQGPFVENMTKMGCKFIDTKFERRGKNPFKDFALLLFYKKMIANVQPDIVLTYTIKPTMYGGIACRIFKVPYIVNITGLGTAVQNGGILQRLILRMYNIVLPYAKCVFFQNQSNMEFFTKRNMVKNACLISGSGVNIIDYSFVNYPVVERQKDKFLFVGRIMKDKGVEELFEAAERIKMNYPNIVFDIVGFSDEDYSERIEELVEKNVICYWDVQKDVTPFYEACSAIVLPSYHEGMANVLLEASSVGRPVIASKIPGCQETFDEGITGFGIQAKSSNSLYKALEKFILLDYSEKAEMGKAARHKMENEFDRNKVVNAYIREIRSIIEQ